MEMIAGLYFLPRFFNRLHLFIRRLMKEGIEAQSVIESILKKNGNIIFYL